MFELILNVESGDEVYRENVSSVSQIVEKVHKIWEARDTDSVSIDIIKKHNNPTGYQFCEILHIDAYYPEEVDIEDYNSECSITYSYLEETYKNETMVHRKYYDNNIDELKTKYDNFKQLFTEKRIKQILPHIGNFNMILP